MPPERNEPTPSPVRGHASSAPRAALDALRRRVREIEDRASHDRRRRRERLGDDPGPSDGVATGWESIDREALAGRGLARGRLHEWCGVADAGAGTAWTPPLTLLAHLAGQASAGLASAGAAEHRIEEEHVLWIGRAVWPRLHSDRGLLERSLFVDPPDRQKRLWAIDAALRCPAVGTVVADGSGLRIEESRRLQLAAESGRTLVLLARPTQERRELSVATSRWSVVRAPNDQSDRPRWKVALLRLKGVDALCGRPGGRVSNSPAPVVDASFGSDLLLGRWALEWNVAKSLVVELPPLVHRPRREAPPHASLGSA